MDFMHLEKNLNRTMITKKVCMDRCRIFAAAGGEGEGGGGSSFASHKRGNINLLFGRIFSRTL